MAELSNQERSPIFLLGVGRCGSTFQQIQLSRLANVWIWGEHDGMLRDLFAWGLAVRTSKSLARFSYNLPIEELPRVFERDNEGDATVAAWLNGFRPADVGAVERLAVSNLFSRSLPEGKNRWGFKEIRYGPQDRTAERLLALFPKGRIVHTVRHPFATIESSIFSWHADEAQAALAGNKPDAIERLYGQYASRWNSVTRYYLDLEERLPDRVRISPLETFEAQFPALMQFLNIDPGDTGEVGPVASGPINSNKSSCANAGRIAEMRDRFRSELADTAAAAGYSLVQSN